MTKLLAAVYAANQPLSDMPTRESIAVLPGRDPIDSLDQVADSPLRGERYLEYDFIESPGRPAESHSKGLLPAQRQRLREAGYRLAGSDVALSGDTYLYFRRYYRG